MGTRMTDTDYDRSTGTVTSDRPKVWPWVLLAVLVVAGLWWAIAANHNMNNANYNNSTQPYGMTPGTGTTGSAAGGTGTSGTGDIGGVGTPSPSPTTPAPSTTGQ